PDPDSPNYQTTMFDADSVICWVLIPASFVSGKVTEPKGRYYSIPALNPETEGNELQKAHVAQLLYNKSPYAGSLWKLLLGFEDALRSTADDGFFNDDLNDVMLGVSVSPTSAVSTAGLPLAKDSTQVGDADKDGVTDAFDEYPTDATRSSKVSWPSRTGYATVMYEDRWPALGDYDFNDLVVDCRLTTVSNAAGKAVDLVGEFKIRAAGGDLKSGLAFTIPVPSASINSVSYSTKQINTSLYKPGANGVEIAGSKNEKSVVPVFSSAHGLFGLGVTERELINTTSLVAVRNPFYLTVTTSFSQTSPVLASVVAGASPDIFLAGLLDLHDFYGMRKEIHTIGNQPTALADSYPFGEIDDRSPTPPETGTYYIDSRGAPWALLLPVSTKYSIERTQLAATYAHFSQWVYSGGADYPDWYNSDKTGYADSSKLFLLEK
ncbi:MAG: LruC domain-containing protein, partial [Nitrospirota bacterium]|nr:LruC domain-containing protein [Nitrospirota bacterium]